MKMKTAPMGQNSWDCYGATVDTTDLKKQLSVLNASLHQAETIKTRLEQQMDNLDVTDTHYDKKNQIYRDDWMLNMIEQMKWKKQGQN